MTFRARLTLALLLLATVPLLVLGAGVRREMRARLDADAARRAAFAAGEVQARVDDALAGATVRLESLAGDLAQDNRFRIAVANGASAERRWLLDWATNAMRTSGLAMLQLQDSTGRILSSGHFRNDFDRVAPLVRGATVIDARTPTAPRRVLATSATFAARGSAFTLVGGTPFDSARVASLSPDAAIASRLVIDDPSATALAGAASAAVPARTLAYLDDASPVPGTTPARVAAQRSAHIMLRPDDGPTLALKAGVTRWLLLTLGATLLVTIAVAAVLARLVSAPLVALSARTAQLDLDRLDQRFTTGRTDEVGALERTLDALAGRLRASVARLRDAERAAATGDLARQVNHDIKNGLAPIRNVLRHLAQVAEREPASLAPTFLERRETLESSVEYLDALARNYARLSPAVARGRTDAGRVMREVARGVTALAVEVHAPESLPPVSADAVVLQRILDNLVSNAVDAVAGTGGTVTLRAEAAGNAAGNAAGDAAARTVRLSVIDTGRGMTRAELDRAFDDFHTTKAGGTGLGLSVVRRLVADLGGSLKADTAPGEGSTFTVELPAARLP